jgi:site-specific recombinase XerD
MKSASSMKTKESFKEYLKFKQFTSKSIDSRLTVFDQYLKWIEKENLDIEQISYNDLLLFMKHCQHKGISQRTIKHYMIIVRHFYDHLIREQAITINPATDINVKGARRKVLYHTLETHELHQLYNQYHDESLKGRRNKVMLGLLIYQGIRTEELAKLEVNDINLREGRITVPGGIRSNSREMKLEAHQVLDMYDYILQIRPQIVEQSGQQTEKLLISPAGGTEISNFMTRMMVRLRKINPCVLNAKQIRTSVITKWLKMHNLRQVQYLAGHRYISSTEGYLQNDMEGLKEEVQQFHPLG